MIRSTINFKMNRKYWQLFYWIATITLCIVIILITHMSSQWKAVLIRGVVIVLFEVILFVTGKFIWSRLTIVSDNVFLTSQEQKLSSTVEFLTRNILKIIIIIIIVCAQLSLVTNYLLLDTDPHWFSITSYICLGIVVQLAVSLLIVSLVEALYLLIQKKRRASNTDNARQSRTKKSRLGVYLALSYTIVICSYGVYNASGLPNVVKTSISISKLNISFNGFKIVLLSDIHLGPTVGKARLETAVQITNSLNPGNLSYLFSD